MVRRLSHRQEKMASSTNKIKRYNAFLNGDILDDLESLGVEGLKTDLLLIYNSNEMGLDEYKVWVIVYRDEVEMGNYLADEWYGVYGDFTMKEYKEYLSKYPGANNHIFQYILSQVEGVYALYVVDKLKLKQSQIKTEPKL